MILSIYLLLRIWSLAEGWPLRGRSHKFTEQGSWYMSLGCQGKEGQRAVCARGVWCVPRASFHHHRAGPGPQLAVSQCVSALYCQKSIHAVGSVNIGRFCSLFSGPLIPGPLLSGRNIIIRSGPYFPRICRRSGANWSSERFYDTGHIYIYIYLGLSSNTLEWVYICFWGIDSAALFIIWCPSLPPPWRVQNPGKLC